MLSLSFDVRLNFVNSRLSGIGEYDWVMEHVIYPHPSTSKSHFIAGMVQHINQATGLKIRANLDQMAKPQVDTAIKDRPANYIIMPSVGKRELNSARKDWGVENFSELADMLKEHYTIVQLGLEGDPELSAASLFLKGVNPSALIDIIANARFAISLENGISHVAGHVGTKCYTIYRPMAPAKPHHVIYPNQVPITGEIITPHDVYSRIANDFGHAKISENNDTEYITVI